jgi:hypothetical protein
VSRRAFQFGAGGFGLGRGSGQQQQVRADDQAVLAEVGRAAAAQCGQRLAHLQGVAHRHA